MSPTERDPFSVLAGLPTPEPDEQAIRAAVAASRSAFLRQGETEREAAGSGWLARLSGRLGIPRRWLVHGGIGLAGALGAVGLLVVILALQDDRSILPGEESIAEGPGDADTGTPDSAGDVRMGAQPGPLVGRGNEIPSAEDTEEALDLFEGERIRLGSRPDGSQFAIYLIADGGQRLLLGRIAAHAGQEIVDATRYPRPLGEPEVIAVATSGAGQALPTWTAFLLDQGSARPDPDLTEALAGAVDSVDVELRINAALRQ